MRLAERFDLSDSVVLVVRAEDGAVLEANDAFERILGYRRDEVCGKNALDFGLWVDPGERARMWGRIRIERRVVAMPLRLNAADGTVFSGLADFELFRLDEGIGLFCLGRNLHPETAAEPAADAEPLSFRALYLAAAEGIYRQLPGGALIDANPALSRILGYRSPAELIVALGTNARQIYRDPDRGRQLHQALLEHDRIQGVRSPAQRRDGTPIWISENARLVRDATSGEPLFVEGTVVDITAQVETENALRRSETLYRELFEGSPVGLFRSRLDGTLIEANPVMARMLGYDSPAHLKASLANMTEVYVDPDERARLVQRVLEDGGFRDHQTRIYDRQRRVLWVNASVRLIESGEGQPHLAGSVQDITRVREAEQQLRFNASHDPLTGLLNRVEFEQRLAGCLQRSREHGRHDYAVLFLDLDGFKWVNDSLGHIAGDELLVRIAEILSAIVPERAWLTRHGGDEFTLLIEHGGGAEAEALARRILAAFETPFAVAGRQIFSSASIGIVLGDREYSQPGQILRDADTAMYRAKARRKSGYVVFDDAMHAEAKRRFELETDIRNGIERGEFCLYFQPIVALRDGAIGGGELLLRWRHPARGLLSPRDFLQVAEETGVMADLDRWALAEAIRTLRRWLVNNGRGNGIGLNVNLDARQLAAPDLDREIRQALDRAQVPPSRLNLELTETVFRDYGGHIGERLAALKALGVGLVVDDFGTGYSSLDSFAASPFDALKIDCSFVGDMESNPRRLAIVRSIVGFATELGLSLTAEGVETEGQRRMLLELGCTRAQGFLFAPALPAEEFEALLESGARLPG